MSEDKRLNEVIRVKKQPKNFVLLDKTFLEDGRLSFKAKGILAYLLSKPDDWKVIVGNLVNYAADGKAAVYAGLKELKECGYYEKVAVRNEAGTRIVRWESTVYEVPRSQITESMQQTEEPAEQKETAATKENHKKHWKVEIVKTEDNSLLSNFQEIENQDIENQFIENRERNNNYYTNKLNMNNNHVTSCQREDDGWTDFENTLSIVKDNIRYEDFKITHTKDIALIDEFVRIMVDGIMSKSGTVRIGGEEKPRELVKSALMKLNYFHLEHTLNRFKTHDRRIKKTRKYILSMLYHSSMELETDLENEVHVEWGH